MAKNPGQNNNQEEGPPDLDELLNDLGKKIGRIFGKKEAPQKGSKPNTGNGSSQPSNDHFPISSILLIFFSHLGSNWFLYSGPGFPWCRFKIWKKYRSHYARPSLAHSISC